MQALPLITPLFAYPDERYARHVRMVADATGSAEIRSFADAVASLSLGQLEEMFIQAFDLNPNSTLEIGWHLFGEQYERGEFLVDLRRRLREAEIRETGELPDHLLHVLPLMTRMEPGDARRFADTYVLPALQKIAAGLPAESPFGALVQGLMQQLTAPQTPKAFNAEIAEVSGTAEGPEVSR